MTRWCEVAFNRDFKTKKGDTVAQFTTNGLTKMPNPEKNSERNVPKQRAKSKAQTSTHG